MILATVTRASLHRGQLSTGCCTVGKHPLTRLMSDERLGSPGWILLTRGHGSAFGVRDSFEYQSALD